MLHVLHIYQQYSSYKIKNKIPKTCFLLSVYSFNHGLTQTLYFMYFPHNILESPVCHSINNSLITFLQYLQQHNSTTVQQHVPKMQTSGISQLVIPYGYHVHFQNAAAPQLRGKN